MIKKDAERFDDFIEYVSSRTSFSPWLDEYDPFTETGVAFVHGSDEDNGQFGIGDIDINFGKVEFTYQDVLDRVKAYCDNCKSCLGKRPPRKEMNYVSEVEELVDVIQDWCNDIDESKMCEDLQGARKALAKELGVPVRNVKESEEDYGHFEPEYTLEVLMKDGRPSTYVVYDNEQSAIDAAADDLGERFHDDSSILGAAIEYFGFGTLSDYLNGYDDDEMEDLERLSDELGTEEFARMLQQRGGVDYRGFAEYNIGELGAAWHLAEYDSKEIELDNGMLAYRVE